MKKIKFRVWEKLNGVMHDVLRIDFDLSQVFTSIGPLNLVDCELMQYTGMNDKMGKGIYEGDILEGSKFYSDDPIQRGVIEWADGKGEYTLSSMPIDGTDKTIKLGDGSKNTEDFFVEVAALEVKEVGNVYENPIS